MYFYWSISLRHLTHLFYLLHSMSPLPTLSSFLPPLSLTCCYPLPFISFPSLFLLYPSHHVLLPSLPLSLSSHLFSPSPPFISSPSLLHLSPCHLISFLLSHFLFSLPRLLHRLTRIFPRQNNTRLCFEELNGVWFFSCLETGKVRFFLWSFIQPVMRTAVGVVISGAGLAVLSNFNLACEVFVEQCNSVLAKFLPPWVVVCYIFIDLLC